MPFRDAYNEVKNNLQQLAGYSPDEALAAKRHYGAPAGLDFTATDRRIKEFSAWTAREIKRAQACRDRLFADKTKK